MEFVVVELDGGHVGVGDLDAGRVAVGVEFAAHFEAALGSGGGDQLDDDLMADQRLAAPVLVYELEKPRSELVPLPGAGRQMADGEGQAEFVGELL